MQVVVTKHFNDRISSRLPGVSCNAFCDIFMECLQTGNSYLRYSHRNKYKNEICRVFEFDDPYSMDVYRVVICDDVPGQIRFLTIYKINE